MLLAAGITELETRAVAIITGFAGIIAAVGGVMMTIRRVRDREHNAASEQIKTLEGYLAEERQRRIEAEQALFQSDVSLAQHGIAPPERAPPKPMETSHVADNEDLA
jgi:hypothetical protein